MKTITLQLDDKLDKAIEEVASSRKINLSGCIMQLLAEATEARQANDIDDDEDVDEDEEDGEPGFLSIEGDNSYVLRIPGELHRRLQARADVLDIFFSELCQKCLEIGGLITDDAWEQLDYVASQGHYTHTEYVADLINRKCGGRTRKFRYRER